MSKRFEVYIRRAWEKASTEIIIVEEDGQQYHSFEAEPTGILKKSLIKELEPVKPFLTISHQNEGILDALALAINQFLGRPDETFNRGKLEATERHLKDMQDLVFKKPK